MTRAAALALAFAALLGGCAAHRHGVTAASVVRAGQHCGESRAEPSARWIESASELRAALSREGALGAPAGATAPVDFPREGVLVVSMGSRPTTGYALALQEPAVVVADGVATVVVRFEEPAPGAILAQVVTSPCLLVRIPRERTRMFHVVDTSGRLRATAPVR